MSFTPNYFVDPEPWLTISFGSGAPILAALTKIDGVSTEHTFKDQKAKEKSGSANVFSGTKWDKPKLTFTATDADDFDDLRALWDLMKPVPGQGTGGATTPTPTPGQTFAIGSPAKADTSAASTGAASTITDPTDKTAAKSKDPDPGPRPPTIAVHHPLLAWHEIFACALTKWEGPTHTDTNGMEVVITIVADKPAVPAGTGTMAPPAPGSQFVGGAAGNAGGSGTGGTATPQEKIDTNAGGTAAGT